MSSTVSPVTHHSSPGLAQGNSCEDLHLGPATTANTDNSPSMFTGPSAHRSATSFTGRRLRWGSGSWSLPDSCQKVSAMRPLTLVGEAQSIGGLSTTTMAASVSESGCRRARDGCAIAFRETRFDLFKGCAFPWRGVPSVA